MSKINEYTSNITISGQVSTFDAFKYILKLNFIIARNAWRCLNGLVHSYPWVFIFATLIISILISLVQIGKARAERDYYNHKNVHLSQKVASYEALSKN